MEPRLLQGSARGERLRSHLVHPVLMGILCVISLVGPRESSALALGCCSPGQSCVVGGVLCLVS